MQQAGGGGPSFSQVGGGAVRAFLVVVWFVRAARVVLSLGACVLACRVMLACESACCVCARRARCRGAVCVTMCVGHGAWAWRLARRPSRPAPRESGVSVVSLVVSGKNVELKSEICERVQVAFPPPPAAVLAPGSHCRGRSQKRQLRLANTQTTSDRMTTTMKRDPRRGLSPPPPRTRACPGSAATAQLTSTNAPARLRR